MVTHTIHTNTHEHTRTHTYTHVHTRTHTRTHISGDVHYGCGRSHAVALPESGGTPPCR
jgi:hypothetical protein